MKTYSKEELKEIIAQHQLWLRTRFNDEPQGQRADLSGANLSGADLSGCDLRGADLSGSDLRYSNLSGCDLRYSDLSDSNLSEAALEPIKSDYFEILSAAPAEAPGVLAALKEGRVDGSVYRGECACLVGTIANLRGEDYEELTGIIPDSCRPAERWFLAIRKGHTPENCPVTKITAEWTEEWLAANTVTAE